MFFVENNYTDESAIIDYDCFIIPNLDIGIKPRETI